MIANIRGDRFYKNDKGQYHREGGPAIQTGKGNERWYINGVLHREDGPAWIDCDGYTCWFANGLFHNINGPARIWQNGDKEWWYNGNRMPCKTQEEFEYLIRLELFW